MAPRATRYLSVSVFQRYCEFSFSHDLRTISWRWPYSFLSICFIRYLVTEELLLEAHESIEDEGDGGHVWYVRNRLF